MEPEQFDDDREVHSTKLASGASRTDLKTVPPADHDFCTTHRVASRWAPVTRSECFPETTCPVVQPQTLTVLISCWTTTALSTARPVFKGKSGLGGRNEHGEGELHHHSMVRTAACNLLVVATTAAECEYTHCSGVFLRRKKLQRDIPHLAVDRDVTGDCERDFNLPDDQRDTHNEEVDPPSGAPEMSD